MCERYRFLTLPETGLTDQVWSFNAESLYGVVKLDGIKHIVSQVQLKSSLVFCVIMASTTF